MLDGKRVKGQQVRFGVFEQPGDLRRGPGELVDDLGEALAGLGAVGGGEDLAIAPETSGCWALATWPSMSRRK